MAPGLRHDEFLQAPLDSLPDLIGPSTGSAAPALKDGQILSPIANERRGVHDKGSADDLADLPGGGHELAVAADQLGITVLRQHVICVFVLAVARQHRHLVVSIMNEDPGLEHLLQQVLLKIIEMFRGTENPFERRKSTSGLFQESGEEVDR